MTQPLLPTLPQDDQDAPARGAEIEEERGKYSWDHEYLPPLAMLHEPGTEHPKLIDAVLGVFRDIPAGSRPEPHYVTERASAQYKIGQNARYIKDLAAKPAFASADEFEKLFVTLGRPASARTWREDAHFASQRVAGMNPVLLRRLPELPQKLGLDGARVSPLLPAGLSLDALARSGRLYLCDYVLLDGIEMGSYLGRPLYTPAPLALFQVDEAGALRPLAIQLTQDPSPEAVFTPADDPRLWLLAKTFVQIADMNHHEMGTHLCRTHFLLEAFAVATWRQLSPRHPVFALLKLHFKILLFNNFEGRELLVGPKGFATQIMAGGQTGSLQIVKRSCAGYEPGGIPPWTFEDWDLPLELAARGVADAALLPEYPYRDDGLLLWDAIQAYVTAYLRLYYPSDAAVAADAEVQRWAEELAAPAGGHVPRISPPKTIPALATILTRILFTCGPQHSAVNFSQYDCAAFAPNMAAAAYTRPPSDLRSCSGEELESLLLRVLPPPGQALLQLKLIAELTAYRFDRLGYYEHQDFTDPAASPVIDGFQRALDRASLTIAQRNVTRREPYPWMLPEGITNSTSI